MPQNLLAQSGAQPQRQPKFVPLFVDRMFTGIWTQRAVLHDPSDLATSRFYGGRPDALWQGSNVELTNRLTLQRRPGLSEFSSATYPTPPDRAFAFQLLDGTIQVIIDTESTGNLQVSSVDDSSGSTAVYHGIFPGGANDAYVGLKFLISGFSTNTNNGTFVVTASDINSITLTNAQAVSEAISANAISSGAVYYDSQDGNKTLLFAKSPGAGQTYFVAVAGILYMGDGVETFIYTPNGPNGTIWGFGLATPVNPPTLLVQESGASAVPWEASTFFSTMGLITATVSATEYVFQLTGVNAQPVADPNTTQTGLSGTGQPTFATNPGGTTSDGTVTWAAATGPITFWEPNTVYTTSNVIFDPTTGGVFYASHNFSFTSGAARPNFSTSGIGASTNDGGGRWRYLGAPPYLWAPSTAYTTFPDPDGTGPPPNSPYMFIVEPVQPTDANLAAGQLIYVQFVQSGGTSNSTYTSPFTTNSITTGFNTIDNQLQWTCLGTSAWQALTAVLPWATNQSVFTTIVDSNGNWQVCIVGGATASTAPTWLTTYGSITLESTGVQWANCGSATDSTWVASSKYYLPAVGFEPPQGSVRPFGGAAVVDSNGDIEFVIASGFTGMTAPTWAAPTDTPPTTTDNEVTWWNNGPAPTFSLSFTQGYTYAYSFYSRTTTDYYNTNEPPGLPNYPNGLGTPTGSETGAISTASPIAAVTGQNTGATITISGVGSTDPAVDTIIIWRSADGGGSDNMFFLTEIPAPAPIAGIAQPWSFVDYLPDLPTATFPGLNNLEPAPIDDENDPPPVNFLPMTYNFQRIWGASGSNVIFSGGPDVITGNSNFAFNPSDFFPYLANVVRVVKTSTGQVVFLTDSIEFLAGGPSTASFYSVTLGPGIGLRSFNALDVYAGEIYFLSADGQFMLINPSLNISNAGFPIGDQLSVWDTSKAYVAVHQSGIDNAIYVADGSTGWWRCNPHQVPGGANGPEPIWSPFANITGGTQMVQSVEITPGIKKLLVGATTPNQSILKRDLSVYTDNGTAYDAFFVMGSIVLVHPGQIAVLKFIECDFSGSQYQPQISYLLNEIAPTTYRPFVNMPIKPVFDPPSLYGTQIVPSSYSPNRYYFSATGTLARCRHLQIRVDFGVTSVGDELFDVTIFGRLFAES